MGATATATKQYIVYIFFMNIFFLSIFYIYIFFFYTGDCVCVCLCFFWGGVSAVLHLECNMAIYDILYGMHILVASHQHWLSPYHSSTADIA